MTLSATTDLESASRQTWDVAVVGAGPAGSTIARELAHKGLTVVLVDRASFPRYKVCGCCLNANALATLDAISLHSMPAGLGAVPIRNFRLAAPGREVFLPLTGIVALSRMSFDTELIVAGVREGVQFLPNTRASLETRSLAAARLRLDQEQSSTIIEAKIVVAADGLGGSLLARAGTNESIIEPRARIGVGTILDGSCDFFERGTLYMACTRHGYLGATRLEDGRIDLAGAFDPGFIRQMGDPARAARATMEEVGWHALNETHLSGWKGTAALSRRATRLAADRIFVVGDAAGYVEPFTGEGMAWALSSAVLLAPIVARAVQDWQPLFARQWEAIYRRRVRRRQFVCRLASDLLRRPRLLRSTINLLHYLPRIATPIVALLNRPTISQSNAGRIPTPL